MRQGRVVVIAQPANLGDVVACLPMAGALKQAAPDTRVLLLARRYAQPLAEACTHLDGFIDSGDAEALPARLREAQAEVFLNPYLDEAIGLAAKAAGVRIRVGNLRRRSTLRWANRFIVQGSRGGRQHQALLNFGYLRALGLRAPAPLAAFGPLCGLQRLAPLPPALQAVLDPHRFNLVLHAKSNGNGREWSPAAFARLATLLPRERFNLLLSGTAAERAALQAECPALLAHPNLHDLMGRMSLSEFIALLAAADGLLANGTGPLHIAAALGQRTLGLFPGRVRSNTASWAPLGLRAEALSAREACAPGPGRCPRDYRGEPCECMALIAPEAVASRVLAWAAA